jgi:aminopeptidase N
MLDIQTAPAAPPVAIRREDYRAPDWLIPEVSLDFDLDAVKTRIKATLSVNRNGAHDRPLVLDGDGLAPLSVTVDGAPAQWRMDGGKLVITLGDTAHSVQTEVEISPIANTSLMGLYSSSGMLGRRVPPDYLLP